MQKNLLKYEMHAAEVVYSVHSNRQWDMNTPLWPETKQLSTQWKRQLSKFPWVQGAGISCIGVLQMNTVGVLQLLNFRRNIFV